VLGVEQRFLLVAALHLLQEDQVGAQAVKAQAQFIQRVAPAQCRAALVDVVADDTDERHRGNGVFQSRRQCQITSVQGAHRQRLRSFPYEAKSVHQHKQPRQLGSISHSCLSSLQLFAGHHSEKERYLYQRRGQELLVPQLISLEFTSSPTHHKLTVLLYTNFIWNSMQSLFTVCT
jgi:hypothetical protein